MLDQHVYLHNNRWAVKSEDRVLPEFLFNSNEAASAYAQYMAKRHNARVIHFDEAGKVDHIDDYSSTRAAGRPS